MNNLVECRTNCSSNKACIGCAFRHMRILQAWHQPCLDLAWERILMERQFNAYYITRWRTPNRWNTAGFHFAKFMVSITVLFLENKTLIYVYRKTPIATTRVPLLRKAIESHKTSSKPPWTQVQSWRKPTPTLTHFVTMCVVVPIASTHGRHSRRLERIKETRRCVVSLYRPRRHMTLKLL